MVRKLTEKPCKNKWIEPVFRLYQVVQVTESRFPMVKVSFVFYYETGIDIHIHGQDRPRFLGTATQRN